ncbi:hypothetical protein FWH58_01870 [Candidatus Saccharibacteria bacterium]|nr:hypothetical protein [Candidatus Saccharibacteria bacterium]
MTDLERELTFLINELPADLDKFPSKIIEDNYIPKTSSHPVIRIRRNGDQLMITKKFPVDATGDDQREDASRQIEHTIPLTRNEYDFLNQLVGKRFKKRRFYYKTSGYDAELDVYLDELSGLAVVDFEFASDAAMKKFKKPDFIGADVTQEILTAGGMLCGKSYSDIAEPLREKYGYEPIKVPKEYGEEK